MHIGKVIDNASGKPLSSVPVSDGRNIVFTDENGCFELAGWERARVINVGVLTRSHNDWYQLIKGHEGEFVFRIDAEETSRENFCFLHVSDTEIEGCGGTEWIDFVRLTVKAEKPVFFAHTGDLCRYNGVHRHYLVMNRETVGCPVRYAIGNHDFIGEDYGEETYERLYGPTWYSFDYGNIHFVVLSIGKGDKPSGYQPEDQFIWLCEDLKNVGEGKKLIVLDHDLCKWDPEGFKLPFCGGIDLTAEGLLAWIYGHYHYNVAHDCGGVYSISSSRIDSAGIDSSAGAIRKISVLGDSVNTQLIYDLVPPMKGDAHIWRTQLDGFVAFSTPTELDGDIVIGTADDGLPKKCGVYRIDGKNGAIKWFYPTKYGVHNDLATDKKLIFAQDEYGFLHCINAKSGEQVWQKRLTLLSDNHTHAGALLAEDIVICGCMAEVYALDKSGNELWHRSLGLNHALYPIANLQIQSAVNAYDVAAVAGSSAASTFDAILSAFASPFGTTCSTFMGQNFGASNERRAKKSFWHCLWLALLVGAVGGIGFLLLAKPVLLPMILGTDAVAIEFGFWKMVFVAGFYWIPALNSVFTNSINAYGYSLATSLGSIVCIFGFRMLWMSEIYPDHHLKMDNMEGFKWLSACFTVSWVLLLVFNIVFQAIISRLAKKKGLKQI